MFITFEGIDGSGKSTALDKLKKYIKQNFDVDNFVFTREPGGTGLKECEKIRELILEKENEIDPFTEALLYLSSRKMHVDRLIKPSLKKNKIILCDRFYDSSFAYQGSGREIGLEKIEELNMKVLDNFKPDYTFYFKIDFETAMNRMIKNNKELDRLEQENKDFFKRSIDAYDFLSKRDNERYIVIDATQSIDDVASEVIKKFNEIILNKIK